MFDGNAYGYTIVLTDAGAQQADPSTVKVWLDSNSVSPTTTKNGGTTTITGQHNALLSPNTVHTLRLSLKVGNEEQSRDFVFAVPNYTVLPLAGKLDSVDTSKKGFLAHVTQISTIQTFMTSLHENQAELAEQQLAGEFVNPETNLPYVNEADPDQTQDRFVVPHTVVEGVINWFEHAEGIETLINFPGDEVIPHIFFGEGVVIELLTYLDLEEGHHKLGLFTEGAHKVNAGLTAEGPVLSQFDNSDGTARVPTYYSRNQFFDVVAPEDGYYPIRVLWFQSKRDQEPGLMLEFFSVEGRTLHLVNGTSPEAIKAYRAGWLADPNRPTLGLSRSGGNLVITYTGKLEAANAVNGEWNVIGEANQSPMTLQNPTGIRFFRAKMD